MEHTVLVVIRYCTEVTAVNMIGLEIGWKP